MSNDEPSNPGELREDVPLRPNDSTGFAKRFGGLKLIITSFTILTLAVTIALATQIYYGDFEIVPHGAVATDSSECSTIGTGILKAGGNAVDAAIAATFCLSVVNEHTTGLDAGGVVMIYNYRQSRAVGDVPTSPIVVDFSQYTASNIPQLVRGLSFLHDKFGRIEWKQLLQPTINLARSGFSAPTTLVSAIQTYGASALFRSIELGQNISNPDLANFIDALSNQNASSLYPEDTSDIVTNEAISFELGDFTIYTSTQNIIPEFVKLLGTTLRLNRTNSHFENPDTIYKRAFNFKTASTDLPPSSPASSVSIIDKDGVYVSLITGLHVTFGSQRRGMGGYILNGLPSDLPIKTRTSFVPLILTEHYTCGQRVVLSCGELVGAAQVIGALLADGHSAPTSLATVIEYPRLRILGVGNIGYENSHQTKFPHDVIETLSKTQGLGPFTAAAEPYPTCNAVQQFGDALTSHSDSRGGGLASRF